MFSAGIAGNKVSPPPVCLPLFMYGKREKIWDVKC